MLGTSNTRWDTAQGKTLVKVYGLTIGQIFVSDISRFWQTWQQRVNEVGVWCTHQGQWLLQSFCSNGTISKREKGPVKNVQCRGQGPHLGIIFETLRTDSGMNRRRRAGPVPRWFGGVCCGFFGLPGGNRKVDTFCGSRQGNIGPRPFAASFVLRAKEDPEVMEVGRGLRVAARCSTNLSKPLVSFECSFGSQVGGKANVQHGTKTKTN